MGLLGDLSGLWNDVTHTGGEIIHSIEDAISRLASLGVPYFASLPQFIQFLVTEGENPFSFLPALVSHIISKGGEPVQVLEELAGGFLSEGPQAYTQKQATRVVNPIIATVQQHTRTASALGSLHQETVTQVKQKLTALRESSPGSPGLQGDFALTLDSNFTIVEKNMATLTGPFGMQLSDPWPVFENNFGQINQTFISGLEEVPKMASAFVLFDLAVISVEVLITGTITIGSLGLGDVIAVPAETGIDLVLVAGEIVIIGVWIIGDALFWVLAVIGALLALGIEEIIYHIVQATTTTQAGSTTVAAYSNPALNPDERKLLQNLKKWLSDHGLDVPEDWLKYLIGLIGATGASIAAIRAMILCLAQKGYFSAAYASVWNTITDQLEPDDLQGAWKDGCGMKVVKGGRSWIHWGKVENAYNGLQNFLKNNPGAPAPLKAAIQATLNYVNEVIDRDCNRKSSQWKDQARGPFWQVLLQESGCANAGAGK